MNALSASILIFLTGVVLAAPRRWAILGMAAGVLYLTQYVSIDVLGVHMFPVRFLETACLIRVLVRREFKFSNLSSLDRWFLLFYGYNLAIFLLRSNENQIYEIGLAVDAAFCYFIFRGLITGIDDFRWFLRAFSLLLIPYVVFLLVEMWTNQDPFSILGGGPIIEDFRKGRVRCMGSFRHPSLLGTLGGTFLPLYIGLSMEMKDRIWGLIGCVLSMAVVLLSNSGGPLAEVIIALLGWSLWPMRTKMRIVRRGLLGLFVLAALVMHGPVWYLPANISQLLGTGGDSWHRSRLMEMAAGDFGRWWLWGMPVEETYDWFPYHLPKEFGGSDITNQFLRYGLTAGLASMVLFIWLLVKCYKYQGEAMRFIRSSFKETGTESLLWGLGIVLAVHIENWFAISYFDQTYVLWFMQLAAAVSISQKSLQSSPRIVRVIDVQYATSLTTSR